MGCGTKPYPLPKFSKPSMAIDFRRESLYREGTNLMSELRAGQSEQFKNSYRITEACLPPRSAVALPPKGWTGDYF